MKLNSYKSIIEFILKDMNVSKYFIDKYVYFLCSDEFQIIFDKIISELSKDKVNEFDYTYVFNECYAYGFSQEFLICFLQKLIKFGIINDNKILIDNINNIYLNSGVESIYDVDRFRRHFGYAESKYDLSYGLSKSLSSFIENNLPPTKDQLEIAYSIYVLLAKVLRYDPYYASSKDKDNLNEYYEVTLENNSVICSTWSYIYYLLLKKYGIDASLNGAEFEHMYVTFRVGTTMVKADATSYYRDLDDWYLSDIANLKYGFKTKYFHIDLRTPSEYKSISIKRISAAIKNVSNYYGLLNDDKQVESIFENDYFASLDETKQVYSKVSVINSFFDKTSHVNVVERKQFFEKYYPYLFNDYDNELNERVSIQLFDGKGLISKSLLIIRETIEHMLFLETSKGFEKITLDKLKDLIKENKVRLKYNVDREAIMEEEEYALKKRSL